jgi:hypothetical protein
VKIFVERSLASSGENKERGRNLPQDVGRFIEWREPKYASGSGIAVKLNQESLFALLRAGQRQRRGDGCLPDPAFPDEKKETLIEEGRGRSQLVTVRRHGYHRTTDAPQVRPPPQAFSTTMSLSWILPSRTASSRAIGIEAAEVLPRRCTLQ